MTDDSQTPPQTSGSRTMSPPLESSTADREPSRVDILWSRKWLILLAVIVVAAICGAVAVTSPADYKAQATVRVSLLQTKDVGAQNAIAANEYAAQYAQIVTSEPVLKLAARNSGTGASQMRKHVSASPLNKYNVIGITATFDSADRAGRVATALAEAITQYAKSATGRAILSASSASTADIKALQDSIAGAQKEVARLSTRRNVDTADADATALSSARSYLASLISLQQNLYQAPVRELDQSRPILTVLNSPTVGSREPQRVAAYTVVGGLVGGVIAAELFLLIAQSRGRRRH